MEFANIVTIIVAVVASGSAYASQRAASRASTMNINTTSRVDMEKDAYERARKFDLETIARQDAEIDALRRDNVQLHEKIDIARREAREARREVREVRLEKERLRERIAVLENHDPLSP